MNGDAEMAIQAGYDDYDTNSVDYKRLIEKISRLMKSQNVDQVY